MRAESARSDTGAERREKNSIMKNPNPLFVAFSPTTALRPADFGSQYAEDSVDPSIESPDFQDSVDARRIGPGGRNPETADPTPNIGKPKLRVLLDPWRMEHRPSTKGGGLIQTLDFDRRVYIMKSRRFDLSLRARKKCS